MKKRNARREIERERGGEGERSKFLDIYFFGVWNELYELSIYRENSQLICVKLWK